MRFKGLLRHYLRDFTDAVLGSFMTQIKGPQLRISGKFSERSYVSLGSERREIQGRDLREAM